MPLPVEAGEIFGFTPDSLTNLPVPPVFKFRSPSWREEADYTHALLSAGVTSHSQASFRNELLRGFKAGWTPESYETGKDRLQAYWDAADQGAVFDEREAAQLELLQDQIRESWPAMDRMGADNVRFQLLAPMIALKNMLIGWDHFAASFTRTGNVMSDAALTGMVDALKAIETENGLELGIALMELQTTAIDQMRLTKDEEKNSSSPSSTDATPEPLENGKEQTAPSPSKASGTSNSRKKK